jgi:hypothetical protein
VDPDPEKGVQPADLLLAVGTGGQVILDLPGPEESKTPLS